MSNNINTFDQIISDDGPVAIISKQYLRPAEGRGEPIFPPTYPMPTYRGRVHTVRDGEYRVSVELPPSRDAGARGTKGESQDVAGYNIDTLSDRSNVCEIDSPQSQANRIEPLFETVSGGKLVPQVSIRVGGEVLSLLSAGHRAADAVVRMSSLVNEFHDAFVAVQRGDHSKLASLAPTSILFGVWDSRGTMVKLPRIIKAEIRATNVEPLTRSAQFNPAANFVGTGAVDEALDRGDGDRNPLGAEGMKHVPAPRAAGGVIVRGDIKRTIRVNLVAIRGLTARRNGQVDQVNTEKLRRYILGLSLVALTRPGQAFLREGCLLCLDSEKPATTRLVSGDGNEDEFTIDPTTAEVFAEAAAADFFGDRYADKDRLDAVFETAVANRFLSMSKEDREKLARSGPITADAIRRHEERGNDPLKPLSDEVKDARRTAMEKVKAQKQSDPKYRGRNSVPVVIEGAFNSILGKLDELLSELSADQPLAITLSKLREVASNDIDTDRTFKAIEMEIKEFNKRSKEPANIATVS